MVAYNTVPLSEDARLNEPKAPQNRKALIALVSAVCFASACAGAVAPSAVRGLAGSDFKSLLIFIFILPPFS